jgi:hypothetical protein
MKTVNRMFDNTLNATSNRHLTRGLGMPLRITALALCSALLLPGIAMAKKPQTSVAPGCVILTDEVVYPGNSYAVKVVRDPSYPDAWRNPTFTIEASYTDSTKAGSVEIQPSLANVFSVTYVKAVLTVPDDASFGGTATILATVEEPLNKRKVQTTTCSTTASVQ